MNYKIRELTVWERALLLDVAIKCEDNPALLAIELISRAIEIEGKELEEKVVAGRRIRTLKDEDLEELLAEVNAEEIGDIIQEIIRKNKIPFLKQSG